MPDLQPFENRSADHLRLVIEMGNIGIWELDLRSGRAVRNRRHDEIFGYSEPLDDWTYDQFLGHVVEEDRARVDRLQQTAIAEKREWAFTCEIRTDNGRRRWINAAGRPLTDDDGNVVKLIGQVSDITETKQNEARLQLITEELNHRVRNMLAVIKSVVRLSAPRARDIATFSQALEGRVGALARGHQLLVGNPDRTMTPSDILDTELEAFPGTKDRVRIETDGEAALQGQHSQGLGLVFHELITNAMKYGALSNDNGHVAVKIDTDEERVRILWKEHGGPPVRSDDTGFGSRLISSAIASHGSAELSFPEDGVECRIELERE
ncbi:PAS domain S-box protein [Altererythrobacter aurantiacus]|uniref:histidine kinase n=1 Tax=Parapontixanthobacter aurantiacus TaxID=1463599 RepID=A0A844ZC86_9SPHN|nr:HWE histidine kinase domain-containing protein [Parapontixanthobacter aurantiacus]MXO84627.1 PAS domain S-box protein [Parapontixanthobacter aurantiacus]